MSNFQDAAHAQKLAFDDSFTIELCLPNASVNNPFRTIMQGLVCVSPIYQYTLKNGLSFGVGVHYSYFSVNQFRINQKVIGGMHSGAAFLKLGYEKFWTPTFGTDIGVKGGMAQSIFITDALKNNGVTYLPITSAYIEPNIGLCLATDVNASFRLTLSYSMYGFGYRPWNIGIDSDLGYSQSELNRTSGFFNIGFGYTRYFNGKKSSDNGWDD